jgi:hypothetical protein
MPNDGTDAEKERFNRQQGGTLSPVMCVDKLPEELGDFASLVEESRQTEMGWDVVFVSTLSGRSGIAPHPHSHEAEQPLKKMVDAINNGNVDRFLAFNRDGEILKFF